MKKLLLPGFLAFALLLSASCTHKLKEVKFVPQIKEYTMLIAGDSSTFKDSVRDRIIEKYRPTCEIHVINIKDLPNVDASLYDVVVIMDTCMAWSGFNPSFKTFLDKDGNKNKTVLSMTAGNPSWKYSYNNVDAITSASRVDKQDSFFVRIDDGIQEIMSLDRMD